jgi:hypothetical protein
MIALILFLAGIGLCITKHRGGYAVLCYRRAGGDRMKTTLAAILIGLAPCVSATAQDWKPSDIHKVGDKVCSG